MMDASMDTRRKVAKPNILGEKAPNPGVGREMLRQTIVTGKMSDEEPTATMAFISWPLWILPIRRPATIIFGIIGAKY